MPIITKKALLSQSSIKIFADIHEATAESMQNTSAVWLSCQSLIIGMLKEEFSLTFHALFQKIYRLLILTRGEVVACIWETEFPLHEMIAYVQANILKNSIFFRDLENLKRYFPDNQSEVMNWFHERLYRLSFLLLIVFLQTSYVQNDQNHRMDLSKLVRYLTAQTLNIRRCEKLAEDGEMVVRAKLFSKLSRFLAHAFFQFQAENPVQQFIVKASDEKLSSAQGIFDLSDLNWRWIVKFAEVARQLQNRWNDYEVSCQINAENMNVDVFKELFEYASFVIKRRLNVPTIDATDQTWKRFGARMRTTQLSMRELNPAFWEVFDEMQRRVHENSEVDLTSHLMLPLDKRIFESSSVKTPCEEENVFLLWVDKPTTYQGIVDQYASLSRLIRTRILPNVGPATEIPRISTINYPAVEIAIRKGNFDTLFAYCFYANTLIHKMETVPEMVDWMVRIMLEHLNALVASKQPQLPSSLHNIVVVLRRFKHFRQMCNQKVTVSDSIKYFEESINRFYSRSSEDAVTEASKIFVGWLRLPSMCKAEEMADQMIEFYHRLLTMLAKDINMPDLVAVMEELFAVFDDSIFHAILRLLNSERVNELSRYIETHDSFLLESRVLRRLLNLSLRVSVEAESQASAVSSDTEALRAGRMLDEVRAFQQQVSRAQQLAKGEFLGLFYLLKNLADDPTSVRRRNLILIKFLAASHFISDNPHDLMVQVVLCLMGKEISQGFRLFDRQKKAMSKEERRRLLLDYFNDDDSKQLLQEKFPDIVVMEATAADVREGLVQPSTEGVVDVAVIGRPVHSSTPLTGRYSLPAGAPDAELGMDPWERLLEEELYESSISGGINHGLVPVVQAAAPPFTHIQTLNDLNLTVLETGEEFRQLFPTDQDLLQNQFLPALRLATSLDQIFSQIMCMVKRYEVCVRDANTSDGDEVSGISALVWRTVILTLLNININDVARHYSNYPRPLPMGLLLAKVTNFNIAAMVYRELMLAELDIKDQSILLEIKRWQLKMVEYLDEPDRILQLLKDPAASRDVVSDFMKCLLARVGAEFAEFEAVSSNHPNPAESDSFRQFFSESENLPGPLFFPSTVPPVGTDESKEIQEEDASFTEGADRAFTQGMA